MSAEFCRIRPQDHTAKTPAKEKGWRLRILRLEGENNAVLYDEQTFPERVNNPNASHFKHQTRIMMTSAEQRWLRDTLTELLGEITDVAALHDEIASLRARLRST